MNTKTRDVEISSASAHTESASHSYGLRVDTLKSGSFTFLSHTARPKLSPLLHQLSVCQTIWEQVPSNLIELSLDSCTAASESFESMLLMERLWQSHLRGEPDILLARNTPSATYVRSTNELAKKQVRQSQSKLSFDQIRLIHAGVLRASPQANAKPGRLRADVYRVSENAWDVPGGTQYQPPSYHSDLKKLCDTLVRWHDRLVDDQAPEWLRAPLFAAHFLLLQPFCERNLHTARLVEQSLACDRFPAAIWPAVHAYYTNNALPYAGKLIRLAEASSLKTRAKACTDLVAFFLEAVIHAYQSTHAKLMLAMKKAIKSTLVQSMHQSGEINARQFAIFTQVQSQGCLRLNQLRQCPWYLALYDSLTAKTKQRDLKKLYDTEVLFLVDKYVYAELPSGRTVNESAIE